MDIITGRAPAPARAESQPPTGSQALAWPGPSLVGPPRSKWCLYWGHGTALSPLAVHSLAFSARYSPPKRAHRLNWRVIAHHCLTQGESSMPMVRAVLELTKSVYGSLAFKFVLRGFINLFTGALRSARWRECALQVVTKVFRTDVSKKKKFCHLCWSVQIPSD